MSDSSVFNRFGTVHASNDDQDDGREPYAPFELSHQGRREKRLMLMFENGQISILSYAYLMEILCTSQQYISLIYTNCVITLKGKGLTALLSLLQDEKIRLLQCYHPEVHLLPADNIPMIQSIRRESPHEALRGKNA